MSHSDLLEMHTPAPGSAMDNVQRQNDYLPDAENETPPTVPDKSYIIPVREERATHTTYRSLYIAAGTFRRLLNRNDLRAQATVTCVSGTVILCEDGGMAQAVQAQALGSSAPTADVLGFYMPSADTGLSVTLRDIDSVIGVATTNAAAIVAIVEEWFDKPCVSLS